MFDESWAPTLEYAADFSATDDDSSRSSTPYWKYLDSMILRSKKEIRSEKKFLNEVCYHAGHFKLVVGLSVARGMLPSVKLTNTLLNLPEEHVSISLADFDWHEFLEMASKMVSDDGTDETTMMSEAENFSMSAVVLLGAKECSITQRKCTFEEVRIKSRNLSKVLRKKLGLNKGDVALIYMPNTPEFPIAVLGCLEAGIVASTVNSMYTPDEIARQLSDCAAKIIITTEELHGNAEKAAAKLSIKYPIICAKTKKDSSVPQGSIDFTELTNTVIDIPDLELPSPDDIAILPYSSGTTGLPKGVQLSHFNIVANLTQISDPDVDCIEKATSNFQEITPGILPMFHIYGFTITTLNVMTKGAKVLTVPRFHPETFLNVLRKHDISLIFAAPPLVLFLTHHPEAKTEYFKYLRNIMSGAAPLGALDEERFLNKVGKHVFISQGYGLTETSPVVTMIAKPMKVQYGDACAGSIGKVLTNTQVKLTKLDDHTGTPIGPNESGEILVKGPQVMQGYHNNSKATKESFQDGWFKTGDLAYYKGDGLLFITDRVKELIKVKGFQVAPAELEELLRNHPQVADAAVIGIPHDIFGEVPRAYIQPKGNLDIDNVNEFINEKVAKYKRLEGGIELVKEIPKNSAGKILRRQLKLKYLDQHQN